MTDIVLVVPPERGFSITPPLGLGYLAANLRQNGVACKIFDFAMWKNNLSKAVNIVLSENPRFVGVSSLTYSYSKARELIRTIKSKNNNIKIIIGGFHVSALPEVSLSDSGADFVVIGEGEKALLSIVQNCDLKKKKWHEIPGIAFWEAGRIIRNKGCNIIEDIDSLPVPAWDLLSPYSYNDSPGYFYSNGSSAPIITSRGCPHQCGFCTSWVVHGRGIRLRNPERIVDELEMLVKEFGIKYFDFCDDSFTEDKTHAIAVCKEIIKRKLDINWKTPVGIRLNNIDSQLLAVMKESGCYELSFGIESYDEEVLRINKKPLDKEKIRENISLVKRFGFKTLGLFILGLPGDTEKSILKTINFASRSTFDFVFFSCAVPIPGTEMFDNAYGKEDLRGFEWSRFTFNKQFNISGLSKIKLRFLFKLAFITAYAKPARLLCLIKILIRLPSSSLLRVLRYTIQSLIR